MANKGTGWEHYDEEEEEDDHFTVDESRVLRAIVHQASHGVADIRGTCPMSSSYTLSNKVFNRSLSPAAQYPWDGDVYSDSCFTNLDRGPVKGRGRLGKSTASPISEVGDDMVDDSGLQHSIEGKDEVEACLKEFCVERW